MKHIKMIFLLATSIIFLFPHFTFSQLQKLAEPNLHTESDIYLSSNGTRYSDLITLKFNENVIDKNIDVNNIDINSFLEQNPKNYFESLKKLYGAFYIIKVFPNRVWGDTIAINKRTNKNIVIPDISQVVQLRFSKLVPIDSIINFLNKQPFIKYAQGPSVIKLSVSPNDPLYSTAPRWAFDRINAERSWEISKGFTTISINDYFTGTPLHEDLVGKVVYIQGQMQDHGGAVAGIAGAMTNNSLGVASLGWNINLMLHTWGGTAIYDAINRGADVINFSWIRQQWDEPYLREALHTALLQGIVCVAGAGNQLGNVNYIPSVQYPAAYNFGTDGQVIAVSATQWDGTYETFVDEWNYSPGTDPINDPTNSFIDISAPGKGIEIILGSNSYSPNGAGTSDASAFVSALCGLILSVNNSLTPNQVYNIITKSAEKVGQYSYDTNGWNRYMGYGRINAYNALKYTLENYGGTLTQNLTIPVGETWNFVPGVTVKFASGITLIINGILNAVGTSSNKIIFDRSSTTGTWGSITFDGSPASSSILDNVDIKYASDIKCLNGANVTIQNSLIDHCTQGIYVYNSQPQILNNQIIEPVQNGIYCNALGKSPLILNNVITKTSSNPTFRNYQGIWLENHTNGYIAHNDVQGFYWGIYAGGGSSGNFTNYGFQNFNPNNRICNNSFGFAAGWGSSISAGYLMYYGMNNSIYNNVSYDVYCYQSSSITAQYNYWGGGLPKQYKDGTSYLNVLYPLTSDPWGGGLAPNSQSIQNFDIYTSSSLVSPVNGDSTISEIYMAIDLELTGRIEEAIIVYKNMIDRNINTSISLTSLARIKTKFGRTDLFEYFLNLSNTNTMYKNTVLKILAGMFLQDNQYERALAIYDEIIVSNENNYEGISARFESFFAALNHKKDYKKASAFLSEISSLNLTDKELISRKEFAEYLFRSINDSSNVLNKNSNEILSKSESEFPKEYSLNQNYPNPFNPTTTIKYDLPNDGLVQIKIFDILGNEVATLVNEQKVAGRYEVNFNASSLASGVYIYKIQAGSFINSKKMILLK